MQLIIKTILFIGLIFFMSCDNATTNESSDNLSIEMSDSSTTQEYEVIEVTYLDATVYAARTDYRFLTVSGEELLIEGNTFEQEPIIEVPEGMVDDSEELDGLPGGHPDMIGKKFKLHFNDDGKVFKIELVK